MTTWEGGSINADEAERLSERFKPIWELDDAPFAAPNAGDSMLDSLAVGGGLAPEIALALAKPTAGAGAFPLSSQKTLLGIATPADEKAAASRTREAAKASVSSVASTPGAARPERARRVEASSAPRADRGDSPARKPRTLLYVVGAAAALVAGYIAFASLSNGSSEGDTSPRSVATTPAVAARPAEPPATAATAEPPARPAATTLAATTATASAATPPKAAAAPSAVPPTAPAKATAAAVAAPRPQQPPVVVAAPPRAASPKAGSQPAGGAIVRSAPF